MSRILGGRREAPTDSKSWSCCRCCWARRGTGEDLGKDWKEIGEEKRSDLDRQRKEEALEGKAEGFGRSLGEATRRRAEEEMEEDAMAGHEERRKLDGSLLLLCSSLSDPKIHSRYLDSDPFIIL